MDKQAWLNSIFNGAPPGGESSKPGGIPAPTVDGSGTRSESLDISWRWNDSAAAAKFEAFELRWREATPPTTPWRTIPRISSTASFSSYRLRGLQPNTQYRVAVQGVPVGGGAPHQGAELTASTAPAVPSQPEVVGGDDTSISLRWRPVSGSGLRYAVYGSAALGFAKVYSGEETRCTVSGLDHGKEYGFRVCAMNAQGGASDFSVEVVTRCGAPLKGGGKGGAQGFLITPELLKLSHDSLSMRWDAPEGGASMYVVELAEVEDGQPPGEDEWSTIYEGAPPGCEISFLADDTEYRLRVAYVGATGRQSAFGPELIVRTPPEPSAQEKLKPKRAAPKREASKPKPPAKKPPPPPPPAKLSARHSSPTLGARRPPTPPTHAAVTPREGARKAATPREGARKAATPREGARKAAELARPRSAPAPRRRAPRPPRPPPRRSGEESGEESDEEGGAPAGRGGRGVHERLYKLHQAQLKKLDQMREEREASLLNQMSTLSLEQRASQAISPPKPQASAFGSSSPRPHLWLGAAAAGGPSAGTSSHAGGRSPRGSTCSARQSTAGVDAAEDGAPGPGAYDVGSSFKPASAVQKDPAVGVSSAFRSKTSRFFHDQGTVVVPPEGTPGVGTYSPRVHGTLDVVAESSARRGKRLAGLRRAVPRHTRTVEVAAPGPGAYEPLARFENERKKAARTRAPAFISGTRRALPWGGGGNDAPRSIRSRVDHHGEDDTPGPGEYGAPSLPSSEIAGKAAHKKRGSIFGRTSSPRFQPDPKPHKITPSPVHYTPR